MFDYRSERIDSHKVCPLLTSPPKQGAPRRRSTLLAQSGIEQMRELDTGFLQLLAEIGALATT
jgi:hypothetical protein